MAGHRSLNERNAIMTLSWAAGEATYAELGARFNMSMQRASQVVTDTLHSVGYGSVPRSRFSVAELGYRLLRRNQTNPNCWDVNTPEGFYTQVLVPNTPY